MGSGRSRDSGRDPSATGPLDGADRLDPPGDPDVPPPPRPDGLPDDLPRVLRMPGARARVRAGPRPTRPPRPRPPASAADGAVSPPGHARRARERVTESGGVVGILRRAAPPAAPGPWRPGAAAEAPGRAAGGRPARRPRDATAAAARRPAARAGEGPAGPGAVQVALGAHAAPQVVGVAEVPVAALPEVEAKPGRRRRRPGPAPGRGVGLDPRPDSRRRAEARGAGQGSPGDRRVGLRAQGRGLRSRGPPPGSGRSLGRASGRRPLPLPPRPRGVTRTGVRTLGGGRGPVLRTLSSDLRSDRPSSLLAPPGGPHLPPAPSVDPLPGPSQMFRSQSKRLRIGTGARVGFVPRLRVNCVKG